MCPVLLRANPSFYDRSRRLFSRSWVRILASGQYSPLSFCPCYVILGEECKHWPAMVPLHGESRTELNSNVDNVSSFCYPDNPSWIVCAFLEPGNHLKPVVVPTPALYTPFVAEQRHVLHSLPPVDHSVAFTSVTSSSVENINTGLKSFHLSGHGEVKRTATLTMSVLFITHLP